MSGNVLLDIGVLAEEVIGALLCNPENQVGWPKIVENDMKKHVDVKFDATGYRFFDNIVAYYINIAFLTE